MGRDVDDGCLVRRASLTSSACSLRSSRARALGLAAPAPSPTPARTRTPRPKLARAARGLARREDSRPQPLRPATRRHGRGEARARQWGGRLGRRSVLGKVNGGVIMTGDAHHPRRQCHTAHCLTCQSVQDPIPKCLKSCTGTSTGISK